MCPIGCMLFESIHMYYYLNDIMWGTSSFNITCDRVCMMPMNMDEWHVSNMHSIIYLPMYKEWSQVLVHYWLFTTIKGSCLHNIACQIFGKILKQMDQQVLTS